MRKPKAAEVTSVSAVALSASPKKEKKLSAKDKVISKKTVATRRAKASPKTVSERIPITQVKENHRKIAIIENISKKASIAQPVSATTERPPMRVTFLEIQTALLKPFSVPQEHAAFVSGIARYAGTAFVVVGALFTLASMHNVTTIGSASHAAQVINGTTECPTGTTCASLPSSIDPTPDVSLSLESPTQTLTGTVPVSVTVPYASRVDVIAKRRDSNATIQVGTATRVSELVWRTYWRTTQLDDGMYRIGAVVTNQFGTYTTEPSTDYIIANNPVDDPVEAVTTDAVGTSGTSTPDTAEASVNETTTTTTDTSANAPTLPALRIELNQTEPLMGRVSVRAFTEGATGVRVLSRRSGTAEWNQIGYAVLHSAGAWRFEWDTTRVSDGEYDLRVQAVYANASSTLQSRFGLTIQNTASPETTIEPEVTTDETTPTTEDVAIDDATEAELVLEPTIRIELTKANPISGVTDAYIHVPGAQFIELYVIPERALMPRFVGLAQKQSDTAWRARFDTRLIPNGSYALYAKVRHQYGDTESSRVGIRVQNEVVETTTEVSTYIETLKTAGTEVEKTLALEKPVVDSAADSETSLEDESEVADPVFVSVARDIGAEYTVDVEIVLLAFSDELTRIMKRYATAVRTNDSEAQRAALQELERLRERIMAELPLSEEKSDILTKVREYIESVIKDQRERTERSETLIRERVGDAVVKDSDKDGISDYDEVNLYNTNPLTADTDGDGFLDDVEILSGYNPTDDRVEANVIYESPKEIGVVRDDLLTVTHITTIASETSDVLPKAHIAGTALPNSFVTLYIFSTPIVVTVKTDAEGNWSYIFDKELEDGDHEVYVGITDNAGRIVAKSNPLPFVKTAQAFTPVDTSANVITNTEPITPALVTKDMFLALGSIAVVALGLVLILLGLHVRPKEELVQTA